MRILVLSNLYPPDVIGGYELGCAQAVDWLREQGHEVRVLTGAALRRLPPPRPWVRPCLRLAEIYDRFVSDRSGPGAQRLADAEAKLVCAHNVHLLLDEVRDFRPEVAYLWNLAGIGGLGLAAALKLSGIPMVWHLMDTVPAWLCSHRGRMIPPLARAFSRDMTGTWICCSQTLRREVESFGVSLPGRVEVLPNWMRGERPPPRESFYDGSGPLRIVSAGQLAEHKGVGLIIEAAAELRQRGLDSFRVDLYGRGEEEDYRGRILQLGLVGHVRLLGSLPQAELLRRYDEYDVFAFPTWAREPFGFAPLEAAARGCLPILPPECGIGEFLEHRRDCLKVPRSAQGLVQAWIALLKRRIDIAPLARAAQTSAWERFDCRLLLGKVESWLADAAARGIHPTHTPEQVHRLAVLGEKMQRILVQDSHSAEEESARQRSVLRGAQPGAAGRSVSAVSAPSGPVGANELICWRDTALQFAGIPPGRKARTRPSCLVVLGSSNQLYSGIGTNLFETCRRLQDRIDYHFCIDSKNPRNTEILESFCRRENLPLDISPAAEGGRGIDHVPSGLPALLRGRSWDFIETVGWANAGSHELVLEHRKGGRILYTPHFQPTWTVPMAEETAAYIEKTQVELMRQSCLVFCDSPWERDYLQSILPGHGGMVCLRLGCDFERFAPGPTQRRPQILFVGDLREPRKRFDRVLATFQAAQRQMPELRLVIAGTQTPEAVAQIPASVRSAIDLVGYISEERKVELYRESAGLFLLSDYEAFGLPILEALACNTPVFLTELDATRSIFSSFVGAHFCPDDAAKSADKVLASVRRGEASIRAIDAQRELLRRTFDWPVLVESKWQLVGSAHLFSQHWV